MPNTMTVISTTTVGAGGAASIDFTSIPSTYTHLCLKVSARTSSTDGVLFVYYNNDTTSSNYAKMRLIGEGTSGLSTAQAADSKIIFVGDSSKTANTFSNGDIYVFNYLSSSQKQTIVNFAVENNANYTIQGIKSGRWTGTSAINRITLTPQTGSFVQHSLVTLYGITNS